MRISLIVAMARNRVIGDGNRLPWHLSADLRRFRALTLGKPILMGRKTHESIGRPLPDRINIILTSRADYAAPGCRIVHSLAEALAAAGDAQELMVIGGATLYAELLPRAERLYLTLIHRDYPGDVRFPEFDPQGWREAERQDIREDPNFPYRYSFVVLERT